MKPLYRSIWADQLENGQELPIGGSIFGGELTTKITLDFDSFGLEIDSYRSPLKISEAYEDNRAEVTNWLNLMDSTIDPYLFFVTSAVQKKVQTVLHVDTKNRPTSAQRKAKFEDGRVNLSDLVGVAMCAEQSALGQYFMNNVLQEGYSASYMGGVRTRSPELQLGDHSFIILEDPADKIYIFDIASPRSAHNLPRILETDVPFTYNLFSGSDNLLVGATEVLHKGRLFYGVGHPFLDREPSVIDTKKL